LAYWLMALAAKARTLCHWSVLDVTGVESKRVHQPSRSIQDVPVEQLRHLDPAFLGRRVQDDDRSLVALYPVHVRQGLDLHRDDRSPFRVPAPAGHNQEAIPIPQYCQGAVALDQEGKVPQSGGQHVLRIEATVHRCGHPA
jgi:hypothetical protein